MRVLQDFATSVPKSIFHDATNLPVFFKNNLVDPARLVKVFHSDTQANIRVFYYQYLKLCFQLQNVDYQLYIHKIEQIINNQDFKFIFHRQDDSNLYNDLQFKSLIKDFFEILDQGDITIEDALSQYPIMDTVFIYFFRTLLIIAGKTISLHQRIDRFIVLEFLVGCFGVQISLHNKCIKFVETDIFLYQEDPNQVFMAYMDYDNQHYQKNPLQQVQMLSSTETAYPIPKQQRPQQTSASSTIISQLQTNIRGYNQIKSSYIASEFVDYTTAVVANHLGNKNKQKTNDIDAQDYTKLAQIMSNETKQLNLNNRVAQGLDKLAASLEAMKILASHNQITEEKDESFNIYHHNIPNTAVVLNNSTSSKPQLQLMPIHKQKFNTDIIKFQTYELGQNIPSHDSFYKTQLTDNQRQVSHYTFQQELKLSSDINKIGQNQSNTKQISAPLSYKLQLPTEIKHTFELNVTKQFTNSFTMASMSQPYKSSVKNIRQRARNYRNSLFNYIK